MEEELKGLASRTSHNSATFAPLRSSIELISVCMYINKPLGDICEGSVGTHAWNIPDVVGFAALAEAFSRIVAVEWALVRSHSLRTRL